MSSQNPYENYPPSVPPTQYSQQGEYSATNPYSQPASEYSANAYGQPVSGYGANPYGQQPMNPPGQPMMYGYVVPMQINEPGKGLAVAGMVLGIIAACLFWVFYISVPVAIVGVVLSALGRRSVSRKGMAMAGLVLSIASIGLTICLYGSIFYAIFHRY